jgi:hypothetical protein
MSWFERWGGGGTHYSDEKMGRAVVVQLVFEERDFGIEQDRVRARELGDGDRVLRVCGIGGYPLCVSRSWVI